MGEDYFRQYGLVAIFVLIAISVPIGMLMLSKLGTLTGMRPTRPAPTEPEPTDTSITPEEVRRRSQIVKMATYESGMRAVGSRWTRFNFRYYYFALLFVGREFVSNCQKTLLLAVPTLVSSHCSLSR